MDRRDFVKLGVAAAIPATLGTSAEPPLWLHERLDEQMAVLCGDQGLIAEKTKLIDFILDNMFEPCDSALVDKLQAAFPGQQVSIEMEIIGSASPDKWIFKADNSTATLTYDTDVNVVN